MSPHAKSHARMTFCTTGIAPSQCFVIPVIFALRSFQRWDNGNCAWLVCKKTWIPFNILCDRIFRNWTFFSDGVFVWLVGMTVFYNDCNDLVIHLSCKKSCLVELMSSWPGRLVAQCLKKSHPANCPGMHWNVSKFESTSIKRKKKPTKKRTQCSVSKTESFNKIKHLSVATKTPFQFLFPSCDTCIVNQRFCFFVFVAGQNFLLFFHFCCHVCFLFTIDNVNNSSSSSLSSSFKLLSLIFWF